MDLFDLFSDTDIRSINKQSLKNILKILKILKKQDSKMLLLDPETELSKLSDEDISNIIYNITAELELRKRILK